MARIDKAGGPGDNFRAPLAASWAGQAAPIGVGLDVNGRVVPGSGVSGIKGVLCKPSKAAAGDQIDVLKDAELVEFGGAPGTNYYANPTTGAITDDPDVGGAGTGVYVGHTVEATRLIVSVAGEVL